MGEYHDMVQKEAEAFLSARYDEYLADEGEHGGKSGKPNLSRWIDRTGHLADTVRKLSEKWTRRDWTWINESSRHKTPWGDPKSSAFAALYQDILREAKRIRKRRDASGAEGQG